MAKKTIYKTVITVTVLSDEPYNFQSLGQDDSDITDGDSAGKVAQKYNSMTGKKAVKEIQSVGSEPGFFQMDEDGNEIED